MLRHSPQFETLILAVAAPMVAAILAYAGWLWRLDHVPYDIMIRTIADEPDDELVIVAIDQRSLSQIGRWPWPRHIHGQLIDRLTDADARAVALNVILAEPSPESSADDAQLVEAIRSNGNVILPISLDVVQAEGQLVEVPPLSKFARVAAGFGHVDVAPDQDGIVRSHFLAAGLGAPRWPSLPLAVLEHTTPQAELSLVQGSVRTGADPPYAWTRNHRLLFEFAVPGSFAQYSYVDVMRGDIAAESLEGRSVLVGVTAKGLGAELITPMVGSMGPMPGVLYNAHVLSALHLGRTIWPLGAIWTAGLSALAVFLPLLLYPALPSRWTLPAAVAATSLILLGSLVALQFFSIWIRPAAAIIVVVSSYPLWSWIKLRYALRYQRSLADAHERALVTLHSVDNAVFTTDADGIITDMNASAERLTGHHAAATRGLLIENVVKVVEEKSRKLTKLPAPHHLEPLTITRLPDPAILIHRDGSEAFIRATAAPINDERGTTLGMVLAIADITETRRLTEQMSYLATHDPLTGLPNRALLEDRLQHAMAQARRQGQLLGLLFVDLDQFKTINDGLGHGAGDALLKAVGQRLRGSLREADTVARFGGDEFVVVLEDVQEPRAVNGIVDKLLHSLQAPFEINANEIHMTCSIGAVIFPRDGETIAQLLNHADAAMYRAKQLGRANAQVYEPGMGDAAREQLLWSQGLQRAIRRDELVLHFQPQVDVLSGYVTGVEALVRWQHPEHGLLMPDAFVPIAESTNLIRSLDDWVIRKAHEQLRAWRRKGLINMRVAVNLSPRKLAEPNIGHVIASTITDFNRDAPFIELEITERTIMYDLDRTITNLRELKSIGVTFAIDDFGTGYSSLSHLTALPVDRLKIDRSFIRSVPDDSQNAAIASAIIAMGKSLGLSVVAEGVETREQVEFLRAKGCNEAQGYLISRPVPTHVLTPMLKGRHSLLPQ